MINVPIDRKDSLELEKCMVNKMEGKFPCGRRYVISRIEAPWINPTDNLKVRDLFHSLRSLHSRGYTDIMLCY